MPFMLIARIPGNDAIDRDGVEQVGGQRDCWLSAADPAVTDHRTMAGRSTEARRQPELLSAVDQLQERSDK